MAQYKAEESRAQLNGFCFRLDIPGLSSYRKLSYPARFGYYHEVTGHGFNVHFNLNGEIKFFQSTADTWPHPHEWIKITPAGDMLYCSTAGYADPFSLYGEYFIPVPAYQSNSIFPQEPFRDSSVMSAIVSIETWLNSLACLTVNAGQVRLGKILARIAGAGSRRAAGTARFHEAIRGTVPVLPPDARHVQYDVLPLIISDGCLHNCGFCTIKTSAEFRQRTRPEIIKQAEGICQVTGHDLPNYNSIFLGQNDALACDHGLVEFAVQYAFRKFRLDKSFIRHPALFMFGGIRSLLSADDTLFKMLEASPFNTYINTGFESFHQPTLELLKKPVNADEVKDAFRKAVSLNRRYTSIHITGNFVLGERLPRRHMELLYETLERCPERTATGSPGITVYVSPLVGESNTRELMKITRRLQHSSRLPCYLYLLLRL